MRKSAAKKRTERSCWQRFKLAACSLASRLVRWGLALVWVWLALKGAVGDDSGHSDSLMSGMLMIVGLMCFVGLLLLREDGSVRELQQVQSYYSPGQGRLRRRHERRIVADSRRNGVPRIVMPPPRRPRRVSRVCDGGVSVRAAKIKPPGRPVPRKINVVAEGVTWSPGQSG